MKDGEIEFLREHLKEICDFKGLQGELSYNVPLTILQRVCFALSYLKSQLEQKEKQLNDIKEWLEEQKDFIKNIPVFTTDILNNHLGMIGAYNNTLDKIEELERNNSNE